MSHPNRPRIAILGLGNLMRRDDGVGVHAVQRLIESRELPPAVEVIDGGTFGLDLLPRIEGASYLLAIDAVDFGGSPGTSCRFANDGLATLPIGKSVHLLGLTDLLNALYLLGRAPREVVLLGVQPQSTDWGVTLSPQIAAALDNLVESALAEICRWRQTEPAAVISPVM